MGNATRNMWKKMMNELYNWHATHTHTLNHPNSTGSPYELE